MWPTYIVSSIHWYMQSGCFCQHGVSWLMQITLGQNNITKISSLCILNCIAPTIYGNYCILLKRCYMSIIVLNVDKSMWGNLIAHINVDDWLYPIQQFFVVKPMFGIVGLHKARDGQIQEFLENCFDMMCVGWLWDMFVYGLQHLSKWVVFTSHEWPIFNMILNNHNTRFKDNVSKFVGPT